MYWANKVLMVKKELVYGADAAPLAANAIKGQNVTFNPLEVDVDEPETVQPCMGAGDTSIAGTWGALKYDVQAAGSGAAGTAPAYDVCLLMSGLASVVTAGQKVEYSPVSASFDAASIYFNLDGDLHKLLGSRSNVVFNLQPKKAPIWTFSTTGLYSPVGSATLPAVDYTAFNKPVQPSAANTPTVSLHGYAAKLASFTLDAGQNVTNWQLVNDQQIVISARKASATLSIVRPPVATKDFFAAMRAEVRGALRLVHGTVAGNIIQVDAPATQIVKIGHSVQEGTNMLDLTLSLKPVAGNDEFMFTIK